MGEAIISLNVNLYHVAKAAVSKADADRENILVAVVFSVMWFESFVNEAVEQLDYYRSNDIKISARLLSLLTTFAELPERLPLTTRIQVLSCLLTGKPFQSDKLPFEDFELVLKFRNGLVHMKPARSKKLESGKGFARRDGQKLTRALRHRGFISPPGDWLGMGWLDAMFNPHSARWAFETTVKMATAVADMFPHGHFRRRLHELIIDSPAYYRARKREKPVTTPVRASTT